MVANTNPDWILYLDADEMFEDSMIYYVKKLINQSTFDYYSFRSYDMWDEFHYREDDNWMSHKIYKPFLARYQPNFKYKWDNSIWQCPRFPNNIDMLEGCKCSIALKHYGWSSEKLRKQKYERYKNIDILAPNPKLIKWE